MIVSSFKLLLLFPLFTCKFITYNAFLPENNSAPNLWRISRLFARTFNPYSLEIIIFSINYAVCRLAKTYHTLCERWVALRKEQYTQPERKSNGKQSNDATTLGEQTFGKFSVQLHEKAERVATCNSNEATRVSFYSERFFNTKFNRVTASASEEVCMSWSKISSRSFGRTLK